MGIDGRVVIIKDAGWTMRTATTGIKLVAQPQCDDDEDLTTTIGEEFGETLSWNRNVGGHWIEVTRPPLEMRSNTRYDPVTKITVTRCEKNGEMSNKIYHEKLLLSVQGLLEDADVIVRCEHCQRVRDLSEVFGFQKAIAVRWLKKSRDLTDGKRKLLGARDGKMLDLARDGQDARDMRRGADEEIMKEKDEKPEMVDGKEDRWMDPNEKEYWRNRLRDEEQFPPINESKDRRKRKQRSVFE